MIYDKIDKTAIYEGLSKDIYEGLAFLRAIKQDIEIGVHVINPRVKAIVSEYTTKEVNEKGYEAHHEYVDIQYLISGKEKICCVPLEYLKEKVAYNEEKDVAFYDEADVKPQELLLGNGYFAILFPQDGHMPCLSVNKPTAVKKVVVKVKCDTPAEDVKKVERRLASEQKKLLKNKKK